MKKLWIVGILWITAFGVGMVHADAPRPGDFARGIRLKTDGAAPVYRLDLPDAVYQVATSDDLGDVRVFNRAGEPVSYMLIRPRAVETAAEQVDLPFFPIHDRKSDEKEQVVRFQLDPDGAVIRIGQEPAEGEGRIRGCLVDASRLRRFPEALILDWSSPEIGAVSGSVYGSDDLSGWQSLVPKAALARLRYGGHTLEQRTIQLPKRRFKYLRILWLDEPLNMTKVTARLSPFRQEAARRTLCLTGRKIKDEKGSAFLYDAGGRFPVDQAAVVMAGSNRLLEGVLSSRSNDGEDWKVRLRGLFYRLTLGESILESDPADLPSIVTDRHWRLEPTGSGAAPPDLTLAWKPHELAFLAEGEGPFTLAFGSRSVEAPDTALGSLLAALQDGGGVNIEARASVGESVVLGGDAALRPPAAPLPWRQMILWAVLAGGVLLLGWMAWRLHREMRGGNTLP